MRSQHADGFGIAPRQKRTNLGRGETGRSSAGGLAALLCWGRGSGGEDRRRCSIQEVLTYRRAPPPLLSPRETGAAAALPAEVVGACEAGAEGAEAITPEWPEAVRGTVLYP